jgi:hypothetical protein
LVWVTLRFIGFAGFEFDTAGFEWPNEGWSGLVHDELE